MSTRAASAAKALRAKQTLVKVLFSSSVGNVQHPVQRLVDHSSYSYDDLRTAYLQRVQQLHPDKHHGGTNLNSVNSNDEDDENSAETTTTLGKDDAKLQFVELKEAWNRYEDIAKSMKRVSGGAEALADFTLFGVGCSFADSEEERALRGEIMDQACRGWFSAGSIAVGDEDVGESTDQDSSGSTKPMSLCDDDMFTSEQRMSVAEHEKDHSRNSTRQSLVSHLIRPPRRNFQTKSAGSIRQIHGQSDSGDLSRILEQVRTGDILPEDAAKLITSNSDSSVSDKSPDEILQFATLDHQRAERTGFPEVVFGEGKTAQQVASILDDMARSVNESLNENTALCKAILATRVDPEMFREICKHELQNGSLEYHEQARIVSMKAHGTENSASSTRSNATSSRVVVATAGTTDIGVAEEAAVTLEAAGCEVDRIFDCGVAGLHRIINALPRLRHEDVGCVIVCAGMDGALPSVVGGLVRVPVIAVPTSIGYGASFSGISAMLTMLNSCAPGVGVVNIDNGFGAAALAYKCIRNKN